VPDFGPELTVVAGAIATYVLGLLGFYLCSLVLILVHELGHLAAGLACGLRLNRFRISGLEFERTGFLQSKQVGHWRWYWKWFYLWSGWIAMHAKPVALTRTRLRYCVYLLGGVLANFLSACLAWPIAREDSPAGGIAKFFIIGSLLMVVGNLIPFQKLSLESDGKQLLTLIFHRPRGETRLYWWTFLARFEAIRALSDSGAGFGCERPGGRTDTHRRGPAVAWRWADQPAEASQGEGSCCADARGAAGWRRKCP